MNKKNSNAEHLLDQIGKLSSLLPSIDATGDDFFEEPLKIMQGTLGFHLSVLYKVANVVENDLILEVVRVMDPENCRPELQKGFKVSLDIGNPQKEFINEVSAFTSKSVSTVNVPGEGCDICGFIDIPEQWGGGFLFAGDFLGQEASVQTYEASVCEIMCNLLSSILMKAQFEHLARHDSLTSLLNGSAVREELDKAIRRCERGKNRVLTVVLGDIDFFKKINDEFGHIQGDSILTEIGHLLAHNMRSDIDISGRFGGEEFLFIFEGHDIQRSMSIVERLRSKIASFKFKRIGSNGIADEKETLSVNMSFGIASLKNEAPVETAKELLAMADAALYKSKGSGRNRSTVFRPEFLS